MIEDNLRKLNIKLPTAAAPVGSYVAAKIVGKLIYISGQISMNENGELIKGKLGKDLDTEAGFDTSSALDDILDFTERNPFGDEDN